MDDKKEVLLRVENLCEYFKMGRSYFKAVDGVNFNIYKGEVFGLVGESGCGKTTTGRTIIRIYDATSGNVYFKNQRIGAGTYAYRMDIKNKKKEYKQKIKEMKAGESKLDEEALKKELESFIKEKKTEIKKAKHDQVCCNKDYVKQLIEEIDKKYRPLIDDANEVKKEELLAQYKEEVSKAKKEILTTQIQMIFQDPIASLNPRMTVKEIISEGLIIKGIKDKEYIDQKVYEMLELVGLVKEHAGRYPHEFSGGQRQRIGIARSIIMQPEMIIADEPISALDVSIQAQVINLLNELRTKLGLTIMFIAHDLSVVKYFSDRIGVMYYGKMVELTDSEELFAHPLHPYTRSLLSAIPLPDPIYEKKRKRFVYNPLVEHDYSVDKPSMREVSPNHFVLCNEAEFKKYQEELKVKEPKVVVAKEAKATNTKEIKTVVAKEPKAAKKK